MKTAYQHAIRENLEKADAQADTKTGVWFYLARAAVQALCAIADAIISSNEEEEI